MSINKALSLKCRTWLSSTKWSTLRAGLLPTCQLPPYYLLKKEIDSLVPPMVKLDGVLGWGFKVIDIIRQHLSRLPNSVVKKVLEHRLEKLYCQWIGGSDGSGQHPIYNQLAALLADTANLVCKYHTVMDGEKLMVVDGMDLSRQSPSQSKLSSRNFSSKFGKHLKCC